jgi:hypothetical protein
MLMLPYTVGIFGAGIMLPGPSDMCQAEAGPSQLQLCAVLGSAGIMLSEYIYRMTMQHTGQT